MDFRFKNTTSQPVQLRVWLDDTHLNGELRTDKPFPQRYRLEEEGHHYAYQEGKLYRTSRVYRLVYDRQRREQTARELLFINHSEVLYSYDLVNPAEIINQGPQVPPL